MLVAVQILKYRHNATSMGVIKNDNDILEAEVEFALGCPRFWSVFFA